MWNGKYKYSFVTNYCSQKCPRISKVMKTKNTLKIFSPLQIIRKSFHTAFFFQILCFVDMNILSLLLYYYFFVCLRIIWANEWIFFRWNVKLNFLVGNLCMEQFYNKCVQNFKSIYSNEFDERIFFLIIFHFILILKKCPAWSSSYAYVSL